MKAEVTSEIMQLMDMRGTKVYIAADLPDDVSFGEVGQCFDSSIIRAINNMKYRYVEGIAKIKGEDWALHAWLTDGIHAFDPTWGAVDNRTLEVHKAPAEYIGIEMDARAVARFMATTGYQGVLANYWRNPELAAAAVNSAKVPA